MMQIKFTIFKRKENYSDQIAAINTICKAY